MRAVVVGAGIGGLAAAIGLRHAGWDVTVLERAERLAEIGAGIMVWSNAVRALEELDLGAELRRHGRTQAQGGMRTPAGRWLTDSGDDPVGLPEDLVMLTVHRAQLHSALAAAAPQVTLGAEVCGADSGGTVRYTDAAGTECMVTADVVVGADGIHSRVRGEVYPAAPGPQYTGLTGWRGITTDPFPLAEQSLTMGRAAEFGLLRLLDERVYWFATRPAPRGASAADEHAEVLRHFGGWHTPIGDVLRATETVLRNDIQQLPRPLPAFATGRVALLGDAAHACTPHLGQGACQALEDAVTLAAELSAVRTATDVPAALLRYDTARRPRAEAISRDSARVLRLARVRGRVGVALRNALFAAVPARAGAARLARTVAWSPPRIRRN